MPKGAKKRAKLKKKQQGANPAGSDDGGNNNHTTTATTENGSNNDETNRRDAASDGNHLSIPSNVRHMDVSEEDSMEDSEEMVTPRAGASEPDEEERKAAAAASEVPVEVVEAGEDVMVDALPPDASEQEQQGKVGAKPEEALVVVQEPEVKREEVVVTKVHPVVHEPEPVEVMVVETPAASAAQEPAAAAKDDVQVVVRETAVPPVAQEQEAKGGDDAVGKDVPEVSRSRDAADTTEVARGPAVAVAATGQRTKWWNCCGILDAFGSER